MPVDTKKTAHRHLTDVIRTDYTGSLLSFDESIARTIREMEGNLADIEQGEWNGMPIREKDRARIGEYVEQSLGKVLDASAAVMRTVSDMNGFTNFMQIPDEARDKLGRTHTVDLIATEKKLREAVNHWLTFVARHPEIQPGIPLAINHPARGNPGQGIDRLTDVLSSQNSSGYEPARFMTNEAAEATIANIEETSGRTVQRFGPAPATMALKP